MTNPDSVGDVLKEFYQEVERYAPNECDVIVLGNKSDLTSEKKVTTKQVEELLGNVAKNRKIHVLEVSAKSGDKVNEGFQLIIDSLGQRLLGGSVPAPAAKRRGGCNIV